MIGMFDPVVTDACRTKPCTGLLSGDDLSIPGGVKPGRERGKRLSNSLLCLQWQKKKKRFTMVNKPLA